MDLRKIFKRSNTPVSIRALEIPSVVNLAVVAPHPDDFDAIGVTLEYFKSNGNRINAGIAETGSGIEDDYLPASNLKERTALRRSEQERSLRFFGLSKSCVAFLDLERDGDDQPIDSEDNRVLIENFLTSRKTDLVLLPHGNDTNSGHRHIYSMVSAILENSQDEILMLLNRDPKTIDMRIDLYTPFTEPEADWKAQLLRFHDSQQQRNLKTRGYGFDDRILNENRQTATDLAIQDPFAEAFEMEFRR